MLLTIMYKRVGMPLVFARYPVDENTDAENRFVTVMLCSLEKRSQLEQVIPDDDELDFGFTRDYWVSGISSIILETVHMTTERSVVGKAIKSADSDSSHRLTTSAPSLLSMKI